LAITDVIPRSDRDLEDERDGAAFLDLDHSLSGRGCRREAAIRRAARGPAGALANKRGFIRGNPARDPACAAAQHEDMRFNQLPTSRAVNLPGIIAQRHRSYEWTHPTAGRRNSETHMRNPKTREDWANAIDAVLPVAGALTAMTTLLLILIAT
jgi:hypothetical protein